jgi:hypothetical protein
VRALARDLGQHAAEAVEDDGALAAVDCRKGIVLVEGLEGERERERDV